MAVKRALSWHKIFLNRVVKSHKIWSNCVWSNEMEDENFMIYERKVWNFGCDFHVKFHMTIWLRNKIEVVMAIIYLTNSILKQTGKTFQEITIKSEQTEDKYSWDFNLTCTSMTFVHRYSTIKSYIFTTLR